MPTCDCLTKESRGEFAHYVHCAVAGSIDETPDNSDIRSLAEVAANSDIDLAVSVYRAYLLRGGK